MDSPNYQASLVELAAHFKDRGLPGVAVEKLRKAIGEEPLSADNIDLYYAMAEACQEMGDIERACEILRDIVGENYNYRGRGRQAPEVGEEGVGRPRGAQASSHIDRSIGPEGRRP